MVNTGSKTELATVNVFILLLGMLIEAPLTTQHSSLEIKIFTTTVRPTLVVHFRGKIQSIIIEM